MPFFALQMSFIAAIPAAKTAPFSGVDGMNVFRGSWRGAESVWF